MKVAIVVTLLSFCATFALPVPVDKSDQSRVERTISAEELESELEEIENHVDAVRKKVKEKSTENKGPATGIFSTPSTATTVAINVKSDKNTKKAEKIEITTPSQKPTSQTITTISPTPTESNDTVVKIQVEKLQPEVVVKEKEGEENSKNKIKVEKLVPHEKTEIEVEIVPTTQSKAGEENTGDIVSVEKIPAGKGTKQKVEDESIEDKMQITKASTGNAVVEKVEEMSVEKVQTEQEDVNSGSHKEKEKEKSTESVVVEEVVEKKNENEKEPSAHVSVEKTANDEELDLAADGIRKNEPFISVEKISPDDKQTNVKNKETSKDSVVVEKIKEEKNKKETKQISVERTNENDELDLAVGNSRKGDNNETVISVEEISPTENNTEVKDKLPDNVVSVKVEKVVNEEKVNEPNQITVKKVENDEGKEQGKGTKESEEEDLETGGMPGKENARSEKVKQAVKSSNDEAEGKSVNLERREMPDNKKEKEDKSVVKETEENVKVAVKKVELVQPRINTGSSHNHDKQEATEEEDLQMKVQKPQKKPSPAKEAPLAESDTADSVKVVQSAKVSNEGTDDADGNRAEEKELEGEQEVLTAKETPEERKIAQAFDKALEEERSKVVKMKTEDPVTHSPIPTTKIKSTETKDTESENKRVKLASKGKSKVDLSIEELELVALAEKTLNEDDKKEQKVLVSTQTSPTTAIKEKKHPKATVAVTKETNENLLSEKETAKEEKKLKEELAKEMEQEKTGPPPLIKIAKTVEKPKIEPTTGTVQEGPDINPNKDIPANNETKKEAGPEQDSVEEQEQQLEN